MSNSSSRLENALPRVSHRTGEGRDAASDTSPRSAASAGSASLVAPPSPSRATIAGSLPFRAHRDLSQHAEVESHSVTEDLIFENSSTPRQTSPISSLTRRPPDEASHQNGARDTAPPTSRPASLLGRSRSTRQEGGGPVTRPSEPPRSISTRAPVDTRRRLFSDGAGEHILGSTSHNGTGVTGEISRQRRQSQLGYTLKKTTSRSSERGPSGGASKGMEKPDTLQELRGDNDGTSELPDTVDTEPQIEATIAEPLTSTRSRKASHYLGLFKENTGQEDGKKARAKSKDVKRLSEATGTETGAAGGSVKSENLITDTPATDSGNRKHEDKHTGPGESVTAASELDVGSDAQPAVEKGIARSSSTKNRPKESQKGPASIEWRTGQSARGTVPLRLLEEIRSHRFPTSGDDEEHEDEQDDGSGSSPDSDDHGSIAHAEVKDSTIRKLPRRSGGHDGDEDDSEFDKERISAATYYPHHTPTLEACVDDEGASTQKPCRQDEPGRHQILPLETVEEDFATEQQPTSLPTGIAGHGTHHAQLSSDQEEGQRSASTFAETFSDTDYESWDDTTRSELGYESGITDKADLTPTATPTSQTYLHTHSRHTPLGAVELKPYRHQVGGHTKVFSFSKQAICKQLNNRENVFYEVIERRHPELLRFMPKYV